ncbi:MAG TPA: class I SAM-dependent methyltransferase [Candidatus Omnitrophota bacterium]|nr:class I SAM-dependent methyltransferase [Candidatus Omnitrophota bacterium]
MSFPGLTGESRRLDSRFRGNDILIYFKIMNLLEKIYLWFRDLVSQPGERGLSSAGYWQNILRRNVLERLVKAEGGLLEIGCGEGLFLEQLSRINPRLRLFGIEREGAVLSGAKSRLNSDIRLVASDALRLAFKDASFEWVVGVNLSICVESGEALAEILREAGRALKPGARLIIEFRNKGNIFLRLKYKWAGHYDSTTQNHPLSVYYKKDVLDILGEAGFKVNRIQEIDFPFKGLAAIFIVEAQKKGSESFLTDGKGQEK